MIFLLIETTYTQSKYRNLKFILNNNKVKNILLEKMIFSNQLSFNNFEKNYPKLISNTYINIWSHLLFKMIPINMSDLKNINIIVTVPFGDLMTNIIHYIYL